MDALKDSFEESGIGSSAESFAKFLDSQKELFHSQVDQLQQIVVTQCRLTGVNPLSQEMAAGAMSIKIGKKPRDLLNPKAMKYLQTVFSMKDEITKKECREISAQFGVTVTQVRDFFASQRARVKRIVRQSREKAARVNSQKETQEGVSTSFDPARPIDIAPLSSIHPDPVSLAVDSKSVPSCCTLSNPLPLNPVNADLVPLNSNSSSSPSLNPKPVPSNNIVTSNSEEKPFCSAQDGIIPGLNDSDKNFVDNIFSLLRKEETFSGQVKLMEWIMQIQNPSVLNWFLAKGGVMILATWLSEAAAEEQTSVLHTSLKVLCHLPLHKSLPEHMSAILQSVNRLRFYRKSDISNRARVLLSRWSKMFARSQALKKPNGSKSPINAQEMILKQSLDEIMGDELLQANGDNPEYASALAESSENTRKNEPPQALKLLTASADDANRKHALGVSSSHARERRKVQLVEQPGQKTANRSPQPSKTVHVSQGRPMSTDDIQKAKMRALFMQNKYGKNSALSNVSNDKKTENLNKPSKGPPNNSLLASKVPLRPKIEEKKNDPAVSPICNKPEIPLALTHKLGSKEHLDELLRKVQIPWKMPPEIKLQDIWRVGVGENSKEVEVQKNRNRREMETFYRTTQEIPYNPKEPWDIEMDFDDSLTPEIPIEQPPDVEITEAQVSQNEDRVNTAAAPSTGAAAEPDLELLAVLLKNPQLVFALTSGQAHNISREETVKLLDVIKRSGAVLNPMGLNGVADRVEEKIEVSLPSPTPSSNPGTSEWRSVVGKNPFSQQTKRVQTAYYTESGKPTVERHTGSLQTQNYAHNIRLSQQQATLPLASQQQHFSLPQATIGPIMHNNHHNPSISQFRASEMNLAVNNVAMHTPERMQVSHSLAPSMPNRSYAPTPLPMSRQNTINTGLMPEPWRTRQGLDSNLQAQVGQNNYAAPLRGPLQARQERSRYTGEPGFESWSPEGSPARNYPRPSSNRGWSHNPDNRSRQRDYSGDWNGNRRYR